MKIKAIVSLAVLILVTWVGTAWSGPEGDPSSKVAKELTESSADSLQVIVVLDLQKGALSEREEQIRRFAGAIASVASGAAQTVRTYEHFPLLAMRVTDRSALTSLAQMPEVRSVVPDGLHPVPKTTMTVPENTTPLLYPQNADIIGAGEAWGAGYTGAGWYVAILDTGILTSHEVFAGKDIVEACFSIEGECPNGRTTMYGPGSASPFNSNYDGYEHGTAVASVATGNSGKLFGVAKDASLIGIQVFSAFTTAADCYPSPAPCLVSRDSDLLAALDYVYSLTGTYPIAAVNMSVGGEVFADQQLCDTSGADPAYIVAIDALRGAGIATVIASGNDGACGGIEAPGCVSPAISVGAVDDADTEANFNDWHYTMLKLLAPGLNIYCATAKTPTSYTFLSGTSLSTPQVTGAWAVLKQKSAGASVQDLFSALADTGIPVKTSCKNIEDYKPRIQVDTALSPGLNPMPSSSETFSYPMTASPVLNFSQAMPVGVGPVAGAGRIINLQVGLARFAGPVDIYLAVYAQPVNPSVFYLFAPDNSLRALDSGLIPWKQNVAGPVKESLYGELSTSTLPSGDYTLYLMITPADRLNPYDLWTTGFSLRSGPRAPIGR
jgi:subtilisin family serine protease